MTTYTITGNDQTDTVISNLKMFDPSNYEVLDVRTMNDDKDVELLLKRIVGDFDQPVNVRIAIYEKVGNDGEKFYNCSIRKGMWVNLLDAESEIEESRVGSVVVAWTSPYTPVPDSDDLLAEIYNTASFATPSVVTGNLSADYLAKFGRGAIGMNLADVTRPA